MNAKKCVLVLFNRRLRKQPSISITVNGSKLLPVESTEYLGFTLDASLNWRLQINHRCEMATKMVYALHRFLRLTWGIHTKNLKLLYKCVFIPTLLYGCSVWAGILRFKWSATKLRATQRRMTKCVARAFKSVFSEALLIITNSIPIDLTILQTTCYSFFRLNGCCDLSISDLHDKTIDKRTPGPEC